MKRNLCASIFIILLTLFSGCESNKKVKDNVAYEYYDNGTIKTEAEVIHDTLAHGLYKKFTPDGNLESVYTYVEGKRQGSAVTYYNNGNLRSKLQFKDNKLNGKVALYYKTGELYRLTDYIDGEAQGTRISYYKNGKVMAEVPYKDDYPGLGIREYDPSGKLETTLPRIVIEPVNHLAMENTYILRISLSRAEPSTTFYMGDLVDGKYIHKGLWPQKPKNGVYEYKVNVRKGGFMMEALTVSATFMTHHKSWAVVSRNYNLAIDNK